MSTRTTYTKRAGRPGARNAGATPQIALALGHELVIDLFAGGGGASTGMEAALGRPVNIAVNHDRRAISLHQANHPDTEHFCASVFKVNPVEVTRGLPVGLLWASPDCTHHSKAKGGKPVKKHIRGLAWVVVKWARRTRPRCIMLENVEEFRDWGPLDETGRPCKRRKGQQFDEWVRQIERLGYVVEYRLLRACDFGAPTIRRRLFLVARCDGQPIAWPKPTHAPADDPRVQRGEMQTCRSAAECIDWSVPVPSIFSRKKPLAPNTLARIAKGIQRFVLDTGDPFIVKQRAGSVGHRIHEPLHTVTAGGGTAKRPGTGGAMSLAVPYFVPRHGERAGQAPRTRDVRQPLPTVTGTANGASLVAAFMEQANTGVIGHSMNSPVSTIVGTGSTQRLVHAHLLNDKGSDRRRRAMTDPVPTVCAGGTHASRVAGLLAPYYGSGSGVTGRDLRDPTPTVTSKDRLQLITVNIEGAAYVLSDIGMRMLQPRELYRAQGFPDSYIIDRDADGAPLPKYAQVRMCGNSVCPPLAQALVAVNFVHEALFGQSGHPGLLGPYDRAVA